MKRICNIFDCSILFCFIHIIFAVPSTQLSSINTVYSYPHMDNKVYLTLYGYKKIKVSNSITQANIM
jgi:hypothetical protein